MAEGTVPPRPYRQPIYCVLLPHAAQHQQLFLSKNCVALIYSNVPAEYLQIVNQLPTIASNVLRPGLGHMLSSPVTGGTWPSDIAYERVVQEKGVGFQPGGEILDPVRTTAWSFMGREILQNYAKLVLDCPYLHVKNLTPVLSQSMDFYQEAPARGGNLKKKMNP